MTQSLKEGFIIAAFSVVMVIIGWTINREIHRSEKVDENQQNWLRSQQQQIREMKDDIKELEIKEGLNHKGEHGH